MPEDRYGLVMDAVRFAVAFGSGFPFESSEGRILREGSAGNRCVPVNSGLLAPEPRRLVAMVCR
jgi:hypothetical protein